MKVLFARLSDETAQVYALILASGGIPYRVCRRNHGWAISVQPHHRDAAIQSVAAYLSENTAVQSPIEPKFVPGFRTYSAFYIAAILALLHWAVQSGDEHRLFVEVLGADAWNIMQGEIYRCVTALLLHKDGSHVLNNMVGLALFGTTVASICGWGVGWFMILLAGATGNLATAMWYRLDHTAIGASTSVFGALGVCVALNLWSQIRGSQTSWRRWLPLAGGLALLGFLGTSPHSDLMAHLMGFCAGMLYGGLYGGCRRRPPGLVIQWGTAMAGFAMVAISWFYGVFVGNG